MKHRFFKPGVFCYIEAAGGANDPSGGAGGGGTGGSGGGAAQPTLADLQKQFTALQTQNTELQNQLKALKPAPDDASLNDKVKKEREDAEKKAGETRNLESALRFEMDAPKFLDTNKDLLPKEVPDIFAKAAKENFNSAIEKSQAIKAGLIQSFFSVQANVDLLTPHLKTSLDEYLKLTNNGKQERAQQIYDAVFEPAFETLKRIKKADALSKGQGPSDDADTAYKNKMQDLSRKHYLGEK